MIRKACLDDEEYLERYLQKVVCENLPVLYAKTEPPSLEKVVDFIRSHFNPNKLLLVAVNDCGQIIGMLDASVDKNSQRSHCASFGMSVLNEFRRQGVGRSLLDELFVWSEKNRLKRIELEVFSNNFPAIELYRETGFAVEGIKREAVRVESDYIDIICMVRRSD
ncbi:N-acetyltransferase family protein [Marinimicrobium sp. ARAG 43.8]|uniref:GNAT family N-acetyltransferase n=1 Tax=Marinimicrobium sp. ARAG 43.8 TaxID=3418719 RepID=UPI003CF07C40